MQKRSSVISNTQKPRVLSSDIVYKNPRFKIRQDTLIWPDGTPGEFYLIERPPFVLIIPVEGEKLLVEEQYRYPTDSVTIEFPAGGIDEGETPKEAAVRELREETGYSASELTHLGFIHTFGRLKIHLFVASGLQKMEEPKLEASEFGLASRWISIEEFHALIAQGKITMYSTLAAWALYEAKRDSKKPL